MNKLYNKIYKAVNEGIQKALLIDPEQNDVSINYSYHKIDNYADPLLMEFIDLGLPSGTLWCDHNIGATCKYNDVLSWYGDYYAWGEVETKDEYTSSNYAFKENNIDSGNDIAHIAYSGRKNSRMAEKVKMPTKEQLEELKNCSNEWVTDYNGVDGLNGRIFTGYNNNKLFIPAGGYFLNQNVDSAGYSGYLWSSSFILNQSSHACGIDFYFDDIDVNKYYRCCGFSVRAVCS